MSYIPAEDFSSAHHETVNTYIQLVSVVQVHSQQLYKHY